MSDSFVTPWTIPWEVPLAIGCPRQEYWSGLPFPSLGIFLTQGLNPSLLPWQADSLPLNHQGKYIIGNYIHYLVITYNEKEPKKDTDHWITLLYTWNTVNQLYFNLKKIFFNKNKASRVSLWSSASIPVQSLVWEDATCHSLWATITEPMYPRASAPQQEKPLHDKPKHCN